jgi:6-phosphogluconolactonase
MSFSDNNNPSLRLFWKEHLLSDSNCASGKFLCVPNRGHNSIAGFTVDISTGRLTTIGQVPTEAVPSAFSLDPAGKFLFAAGSESVRLASYQINGDTGELTTLETYTVGKRPMWVLVTSLED